MGTTSLRRVESILAPVPRAASRRRLCPGRLLLCAASLSATVLALPAWAVDLVSVNINGVSGNLPSGGAALSADGNVVAFFSDANNLVSGDSNQARDVFVRDRNALQTERVSVSSAGGQANGASQSNGGAPAINDDGTLVAFYSDASNLVAGDSNGAADVFLRNRAAGTTELVSVSLSGKSGNGASRFPSISADGRLIAFQSAASDLVAGDTNNKTDIFVRDLQSGVTERLCGVEPNADSSAPSISADGNFVAFVSSATNLVVTDTKGRKNVFVCDRAASSIELISVNAAGAPGNADSIVPVINGDGSVVAFKSNADNLVAGDSNGNVDVFVRDRMAGATERISISVIGTDSNGESYAPAVSRDGRFVVFGSEATNLVSHDTNTAADLFVRDRQNRFTLLADLLANGFQPSAGIPDAPAAISADDKTVAFASFVSQYVPNDLNEQADVFASSNPFVCAAASSCPVGFSCVAGFCTAPTPTPTPSTTPTKTGTPTVTPTVTPTPTPTPTISCFVDTDCPRGQVCDPVGKYCKPAPTPTPLTPCTTGDDCPPTDKCVDGFCQPKVTPTATITPTPLPTCTTDAECVEPGTHCRAGVCVPVRECDDADPNVDRKQCRGDREACVEHACECGGDCNLDGLVLGNEVSQMVCVLSGQCPLSQCAAGDFNGDGTIKGSEICTAVTNLGLGCPGEGQPLVTGQAAAEVRSLDIGSDSGAPGTMVTIGISLSGGGNVATAQTDVLLDTTVLEVPIDASTACTVDPRVAATDVAFAFLPQTPPTAPGMARLRLFVADLNICRDNQPYPLPAFTDGSLVLCQFRINPLATPGTVSPLVAERLNIGDPRGVEYIATSTAGSVTVTAPPPCAEETDCPGGTHCRDSQCIPVIGCNGPAQCPGGNLETCVNGVCECVGDCNLDGNVFVNEITIGRRIALDQLPLNACPAADSNLDGFVFVNEITFSRKNAVSGCPLGRVQP
ncbi:MAG: domain protein beta Propeller [Deltaproteobacteria bacterium]|nr:domain protein beta Propeller [Deltaproteobacteria bacterium]